MSLERQIISRFRKNKDSKKIFLVFELLKVPTNTRFWEFSKRILREKLFELINWNHNLYVCTIQYIWVRTIFSQKVSAILIRKSYIYKKVVGNDLASRYFNIVSIPIFFKLGYVLRHCENRRLCVMKVWNLYENRVKTKFKKLHSSKFLGALLLFSRCNQGFFAFTYFNKF